MWACCKAPARVHCTCTWEEVDSKYECAQEHERKRAQAAGTKISVEQVVWARPWRSHRQIRTSTTTLKFKIFLDESWTAWEDSALLWVIWLAVSPRPSGWQHIHGYKYHTFVGVIFVAWFRTLVISAPELYFFNFTLDQGSIQEGELIARVWFTLSHLNSCRLELLCQVYLAVFSLELLFSLLLQDTGLFKYCWLQGRTYQ